MKESRDWFQLLAADALEEDVDLADELVGRRRFSVIAGPTVVEIAKESVRVGSLCELRQGGSTIESVKSRAKIIHHSKECGIQTMNTHDIEREVQSFVITQFQFGQPLDLQPYDSLLEKGLIDSTGIFEVIAFLEDRFMITVEDEDLAPENLDSIRNIAVFVARKLENKSRSNLNSE